VDDVCIKVIGPSAIKKAKFKKKELIDKPFFSVSLETKTVIRSWAAKMST